VSRLSYKTLFIILFLLLIPIVFLLRINQKSKNVSAAWWNDSWNYRQAINIPNPSESNLTDFQISINIGTSALIASNKMQSDCDDIRITDKNGNLLPHWIEENNPGCNQASNTKIWLKINSLPTSGTTIYVYYGNQIANNSENGSNVFLEFDDFNNSSTISNWTLESNPSTTYSIAGGTMSAVISGGDYSSAVFGSNYTDFIVNSRYKVNSSQTHGGFVFRAQAVAADNSYQWVLRRSSSDNRIQKRSGGSQSYLLGGSGGEILPSTLSPGNWHSIEFRVSGTQIDTYFNNQQAIDGNFLDTSYSSGKIGLLSYDGTENYDYIFVRKYTSSPVSPASQSEEIRPQGIDIGGTSVETPSGNLVAYYKFDEVFGSVVNNSGSLGSIANGGLPSGTSAPTWIENGKISKGLHFDNNDYINLPNNLGYTNQVSVFAWFKSNGTPAGSYHIIIGGQELEMSVPVNGQLRTGVYTNTRYVSNHGSGLVDNQWHHIGFTFDGSTKKSYIDGRFVGEQVGIGGTLRSSFANRRIGRFGTDTTYFLNGYLDEVKIYDYALSSDEIKREYNQSSSVVFSVDKLDIGSTSVSALYCIPGSTDPCSPPVAEWNFEEGTGTTAYDTSGNGNNGTLINSPKWTIGKIGNSLKFNSSNSSYLISSKDPGTMPSGTYSLWVKPSTTNATMGWIDSNFDIFQWSGNLVYFRAGNQSSVSISNWIPNTWHHLTLTWNASNYYGYIDGNQVTSGIQSGSRSGLINIGRVDNNFYFDGSIDQVRIYNYARTPAQIAWDYNQGAPVGWWKMDECQGSTIHDSSGNANHGVLSVGVSGTQNSSGTCITSGAWANGASGKFNSSLSLDGTDDKTHIGTTSITIGNDFSISSWIKSNSSLQRPILSNRSTGRMYYGISSGKGFIYYNGSTPPNVNGNVYINDNNWHNILFVRSGTTSTLYIDGKLDISTAQTGYVASSSPLSIGYDQPNSEYFPGQIDDIRIYNYALTSEQVKQIYNSGTINFN